MVCGQRAPMVALESCALLEALNGADPIAITPAPQASLEKADALTQLIRDVLPQCCRFKELNRAGSTFHHDSSKRAKDDPPGASLLASALSRIRAQSPYAVTLRARLHPGGKIHVVAHHREIEPGLRAQIPDDRLSGMKTDAHAQMLRRRQQWLSAGPNPPLSM